MILDVDKLTTGYPGERDIVRSVSLTLAAGECLLICGHNGSGKSTLLKALAGLLPVRSGRLCWDDRPIAPRRPGAPTYPWAALMLQRDSIFPELNVRDNFRMAAARAKAPATVERRVKEELPVLAEMWTRRAGLLSGGQRKVLAAAMTLSADTPLLLLDEPLAGLSETNAVPVLAALTTRKADGAAIVIVEHSSARVGDGLVDRTAGMVEGDLRMVGPEVCP